MIEMEPESEWSSEGPIVNDLWKKIQLPFLTPPCSPYREADLDLTSPLPHHEDFTTIGIPESFLTMPTTDLPLLEDVDLKVDLEAVIDLENELDGCETGGMACQNAPGSRGTCTSCTQLALAGSELRHDCMWQGTCTADAHAYHHSHLDATTPTLQQLNSRTHRDSTCSHLADLLEANGGLDGFSYLSDFDDLHDDSEDTDDLHHPRPDTPSESSETDTDEDEHATTDDEWNHSSGGYFGVSHEEEITTSTASSTSSATVVHVDHSYYCPRIPSPAPTATSRKDTTIASSSQQQHRSQRYHSRSSRQHMTTDSEDEIDVVSVGSADSAYSSSSSQSGSSKGGGGGDTRGGSEYYSSDNIQLSPHDTATTTTYVPSGFRRLERVRTSPTKPRKRNHKQLQQEQEENVSISVKRRGGIIATNQNNTVCSRKSSNKGTKRHQQQQQQRGLSRKQQRRAMRSDLNDPEKRHLHNSLERMRRVDQKKAFEHLRFRVPELAEKEKVPKVEILKMAAQHITKAIRKERTLEEEKERLRQHQKELKKRLQVLQRQMW